MMLPGGLIVIGNFVKDAQSKLGQMMAVLRSTMPARGEARDRARIDVLPISMPVTKGHEEEDRYDICLSNKNHAPEYMNKVEKELDFERQACLELCGIEFRGDDNENAPSNSYTPKSEGADIPHVERSYNPKAEGADVPHVERSYNPKAEGADVPHVERSYNPKAEGADIPHVERSYNPKAEGADVPHVERSYNPKAEGLKLISMLILLWIITRVEATTPLYRAPSTLQLPPACLETVRSPENECPFSEMIRTDLNKLCCTSGEVLHIQKQHMNGSDVCLVACLPDQVVPAGKIGKLVDKGGQLEVDMETPCAEGWFRSESIKSSQIKYGYCLDLKTRLLQGTGQEACFTGPAADDLLYCKVGFTSNCSHGVNDVTPPYNPVCEPVNCVEGLSPFRDMTGRCTDPNTRVTYGCRPQATINTTSDTTPVTVTTAIHNTTTSGAILRRIEVVTIVGSVFGGLIFFALLMFGIWYVVKKKLNGKKKYATSSSSSVNDPESGENMMMDDGSDDNLQSLEIIHS